MSNLHPVFVEIFAALGMPQNEAVSAERAAQLRVLAYVDDLQRHDWTHEFSDDHRVWKRGRVERQHLLAEQAAIDVQCTVWNRYCHPDYLRSAP